MCVKQGTSEEAGFSRAGLDDNEGHGNAALSSRIQWHHTGLAKAGRLASLHPVLP